MTAINPNSVNTTITTSQNVAYNSETIDAAKSDLQKLFVEQGTINEGSKGAERINAQIATLEAKIKDLEEQAQKLYDDIEAKEKKVDDKSGTLAEIAAKVTQVQGKFKTATIVAAKRAAGAATDQYKAGSGGADFGVMFSEEFEKQLQVTLGSGYKGYMQKVYEEFKSEQNSFKPLITEITGALDDVKGLQTQVKNINATKSLLTRTANVMKDSLVADAYKNCDTDTSIPMFSGQKAEFANQLLAKYQSRNAKEAGAGVDLDKAGAADAAKADAAKAKWTPAADAKKYSTGDMYSAQANPELMTLRENIKNGMLDDLQAAGMSVNDIMTFVTDNYKVGITKNENGGYKIPKGHSSDAWCKEPAYDALANLVQSGSSKTVGAETVNQTQMAEMKDAVMGSKGDGSDGILTQMYEKGFSFKEAMYTLTKLFPDAGITYDPTKGERGYSMVADSEESGKLYETINNQTKNYWDVGKTDKKITTDEPAPVTRHDPVTFQEGDTTYTFIIDRNGDGKFDYTDGDNNELLGSQGGMEELMKYAGEDGILSAEEMAANGIMLMANKQTEDYNSGDTVKSNVFDNKNYTNSVDFNVSFTTAADLGIESLDLSGAAKGNGNGDDIASSTRGYDGAGEEYDDINGSSVINTFKINKTADSKLTADEARETLNTKENLDTFYGTIANNANASQAVVKLTDEDVNNAFDKAEGSDKIDGIVTKLEQMQEAHKNDPTSIGEEYEDVFKYDPTKDPLSEQAISDIKKKAAAAAEEKSDEATEKAEEAAADAVEEYYKEKGWAEGYKDDASIDDIMNEFNKDE